MLGDGFLRMCGGEIKPRLMAANESPHPFIDLEPVKPERLTVDIPPPAMSVGDRVQTDIADRRFAFPDENGSPVDHDPVDEIRCKERAGRGGSALDQQVIDVMERMDVLRGA